ncbi:SHOCT domain-containing protein [Microbacterium sp. W4I20]|uniref:SHOCT domain-containing protein n=1 Tax=Microbacterium sp. W4I20 TaxID=3042262 RepID=UPI00277EBCDB|nr:SHOCT domain-containing protein [Microbacterium sp. W4I20]MDQ0727247.1 hypothetical protein [Microbacterium sp. W4I20]
MFSKLGSAVKKAAADKKATKEEEARAHSERAQAAGALVTSGVFGTATIEIYEGGYVRVAGGGETNERAVGIAKNTPYERLRSISFASPEAEKATADEPGSPIEGAVMQAMSGIIKGGRILSKGTAIGLATSSVAQIAANSARKSNLVIATDKTIHTLVNQKSNGWMNVTQKEHNAVAMALVEAGNAVLGISTAAEPEVAIEAVAVATTLPAAPTLSDRIRELSELHREGILSDEEFAGAKAKLLAGL